MKKVFILVLLTLFNFGWADDPAVTPATTTPIIVSVGEAMLEKQIVAVTDPWVYKGDAILRKAAVELGSLIANDFAFYQKKFSVPNYFNNGDYAVSDKNFRKVDVALWKSKNVNYVIQLKLANVSGKSLENIFAEIYVYDVASNKELGYFSQNLSVLTLREKGHILADFAYQKMVNRESIFKSKILFVSDRGSTPRKVVKELYLMDFDGNNARKVTNHNEIVISPDISWDKSKAVYSLLHKRGNKKNIDLFMVDLATFKTELVSSMEGINSGAIFLKGDQDILVTLSMSGNAEIYKMDLRSKQVKQITKNLAEDVDPSLSRDGTKMTFLSNRPGKAMVYTLDPNGVEKDVKRITFVGKYNSSPRFNPNVFSSWVDNGFDLYRVDSTGSELVRLTKDFGSNEDPSFSNDGEFIVFSSKRILSRTSSVQELYIMDRDGDIIGAITSNFGNCISPRWSK